MRTIVTAMGAAVMAAGLAVSGAQAQSGSLGWVAELSGSCWQGVNANGAQTGRQCFQTQFGRFLRTSITRGDGFSGASVLGWNATRHRLEMYAWSNQYAPAIYTPDYDQNAFTFADTDGRVVWRRVDDNSFQIASQRRDGAGWADHTVITYHRDGAAPAPFEATGSDSIAGASGGLGWLDVQAGHCFHQVEPRETAANRGCLAWEYPHALHQTWYWGSANATGEAIMFRDGDTVRSFAWDAQGNFGIGAGAWANGMLVSSNDAVADRRTVLRRTANGFSTTTEVRDEDDAGRPWMPDHSIRLRND